MSLDGVFNGQLISGGNSITLKSGATVNYIPFIPELVPNWMIVAALVLIATRCAASFYPRSAISPWDGSFYGEIIGGGRTLALMSGAVVNGITLVPEVTPKSVIFALLGLVVAVASRCAIGRQPQGCKGQKALLKI
jgi:hypothetical protein